MIIWSQRGSEKHQTAADIKWEPIVTIHAQKHAPYILLFAQLYESMG